MAGRTLRARLNGVARAARGVAGEPIVWQLESPRPPGDRFAGRSVLITGAAGLIGTALVRQFLAAGAVVHALDRDEVGLERVTGATDDEERRVVRHLVDLRDPEAIDAFASRLEVLDVLVNNAGENDYVAAIGELTATSWDQLLASNLVGPALLTAALADRLTVRPGGAVVFVTSINGAAPSRWLPYAAAKAALAKFTEDLALQLAPRGVRVNAVAPGGAAVVRSGEPGPHSSDALLGGTMVPVEAVVHAVVFLADPRTSPMTTGQQLLVDGGARLARFAVP